MKIGELSNQTPLELTEKFSLFERCFTYPYGEGKRFSIDHGKDYNAFYRAMGNARTYYLEKDNMVIGAIGSAIKEVSISGKETYLAYIGDLKIIPKYQGSRAILHLLKALKPFLQKHADAAYCVVMDGTDVTPSDYTGRGDIPPFNPTSKRYIIRFQTDATVTYTPVDNVSESEGWVLFSDLTCNVRLSKPADYNLRSEHTAYWISDQKTAVGMLEDTQKAKRLYLENGEEMLSSHLSYFSFSDELSAVSVIAHALNASKERGYPAMFVALSESEYECLASHLSAINHEVATATVYSTNILPDSFPINTSEI